MDSPRTPTRSKGEIDKYVQSLNLNWNLALPTGNWSPLLETNGRTDKEADAIRCIHSIKLLYFRDPAALDKVIDKFEKYSAPSRGWVHKPNQEEDTLPSGSMVPGESFPTGTNVPRPNRVLLMQRLLKFLEEEVEPVRARVKLNPKTTAPLPRVHNTAVTTMSSSSPHAPDQDASTLISQRNAVAPRSATTAKGHLRQLGLDRHISSIPSAGQLEVSDGCVEKRSCLFDEMEGENDTENEEYYSPPESPSSPSLDYESRCQTKARRLAGAESSPERTQDWVLVPESPSPLRKAYESPTHSPKRPSVGFAELRHRKSPRASPEARSHLVKVNTYMSQAGRPMSSMQSGSLPSFPLFPPAPHVASPGFTTTANTSFSESIFSGAPGDGETNTSVNTSFRSNLGDPFECHNETTAGAHPYTGGIEMALDTDATVGGEGEAMVLGEWGNRDVEMALPAEMDTLEWPDLSQPLQSMAVQSPAPANSPFGTNEGHIAAGPSDVMNTPSKPNSSSAIRDLEERLFKYSPFAQQMPTALEGCPLRVRYEINRIALEWGVPMSDLPTESSSILGEYGEMWSLLDRIAKPRGENLPERSSDKAWESAGKQFDNVALTGDLLFNHPKESPLPLSRGGPLFSFRLKPLRLERSCRLFRRFGNDRFIVIGLPLISSLSARWKVDKTSIQKSVINWLIKGRHEFLGREWKAFYLKMQRGKSKAGAERYSSADDKWLVYFFAVDGCDFVEGTKPPKKGEPVGRHSRMTLTEMLEWFMPFEPNRDKTCCKAFARLALAVSQTYSTLVFRPEEIRRREDKKSDPERNAGERKVMNDGCAQISRPAAHAIAEMLHLDDTPSAFQGRIAGAKGLWMVDTSEDPTNTSGDRGYWIEITDSQLKFEGHPIDLHQPDDDRMTFEVNHWSRPLKVASLNFQYLPILECQGVPRHAIEKHLRKDLEFRISGLMKSLEDPVAFRSWIHEIGSSVEERVKNRGVQFLGGLPTSRPEKINWLLESGFSPKTCSFLRELAKDETKNYCDRLRKKMHIEIGQSTNAFCVADPLGVLEEGEVHFGFSTTFKDPRLTFQDTLLHNRDVLVARSPAALPSDLQKVRAIFKPELRFLKDVIVFSTKGSTPLAEKLSGGDYDGDRVWVCWDPEFVKDFENAPLPEPKPVSERLENYGITQDKLRLMDLPSDPDERTLQFLLRGFNANLEESLMGVCTNFHERFCYRAKSIKSPEAIELAILLGLLVDREKQGYVFTNENWVDFRRRISPMIPPKPAYKEDDRSIQTDHVIDHMVFGVAKPVIDEVLIEFHNRFPDPPKWDSDLVQLWKREWEAADRDGPIHQVLSRLLLDIDTVWNSLCKDKASFSIRIQRAYDRFNEIAPLDIDHPLLRRWKEDADRSLYSHWKLLRASAAFHKCHAYGRFVWDVAGRELGQLKALASSSYNTVVTPIHASYKPDRSYVRRILMQGSHGVDVDVDVESVMGGEGDEEDSDGFVSVYEYNDWWDEEP